MHTKTVEKLSSKWREPANHYVNHQLLENWLNNPDVMALQVLSAVIDESYNFLLDPLHKDYAEIEILSTKAFNIDPRYGTSEMNRNNWSTLTNRQSISE